MARERKGSIIERNGKLYARVRFKDENGKQRDLWRAAADRKQARLLIKQLLKEVENSTPQQLDALNMTFAELADYFTKNYLHAAVYVGDRKVSGVRSLIPARTVVQPLVAYFGPRKLRSITYGDLRAYKHARLQTPTKYGKQRSIACVNKELGQMRRMLNIAVREHWLQRNPFNSGECLISSADETHRTRILTREEEARLLDAIEGEPKRAHLKGILLIALDCALRRGEIFTLRWSDVDLERRTITVRAFNAKTARSRTVAMTTRVYEYLMMRWWESSRDSDALVFGVRVTIKTAFSKALKAAGIADFHLHDCRHTAITRMIRAGMPPVEVMRVSGHTTMSAFYRYANVDMDSVFRAATLLDAFNAGAHAVAIPETLQSQSSESLVDIVSESIN